MTFHDRLTDWLDSALATWILTESGHFLFYFFNSFVWINIELVRTDGWSTTGYTCLNTVERDAEELQQRGSRGSRDTNVSKGRACPTRRPADSSASPSRSSIHLYYPLRPPTRPSITLSYLIRFFFFFHSTLPLLPLLYTYTMSFRTPIIAALYISNYIYMWLCTLVQQPCITGETRVQTALDSAALYANFIYL